MHFRSSILPRIFYLSKRYSKGFYSFYVFVLLLFIGLAIGQYFSLGGREQSSKIKRHIEIQMKIYASNLLDLGKSCVRRYPISSCKRLHFDFDGYQGEFFMSSCKKQICIIDLALETISPLDSSLIRYTQRAIWDLNNLKNRIQNAD